MSEVHYYLGHTDMVTAVKFSPNGKNACSGDKSGVVHVWNTINFKKKMISKVLNAPIRDLCWTGDNKRICAVGDGGMSAQKGKCFTWDSGSGLGDMHFHLKNVLTVDITPKRPFRLLSGSEDNFVALYKGPPFKEGKKVLEHKGDVKCLRFSPTAEFFVTTS